MLKERIESELINSLKKKEEMKLSVLRMLSSAIHNREIEKRSRGADAEAARLSEDEVIQVIHSEFKKRTDAVDAYRSGGRQDAAKREQTEAEFLNSFLPPELSDKELEAIISEGKAEVGAAGPKDFGKLMGWVMGRVKGRVSGERASEIIRRHMDAL